MSTTRFTSTNTNGEEEDPALEHRVVAVEDRVAEPRPDPGIREHGLGQDRSGEKQPCLEPDDRHHRKQRVPEDVAAVDDGRRNALRPRSAHVVLVLDVEHRGARDASDDGKRDRGERDGGEDEVLDHVPEHYPVPRQDRVEDVEARRVLGVVQEGVDAADAREPPEPDREHVLEEDRQHEDRDRDPDQRDEQARVVEGPAVALRGDEPERDAEEGREEHRRKRELDSRGKPLADLLGDGSVRRHADPQVALDDGRPEVGGVLLVDRLLEPVLLLVPLDELRRRALAEERLGGPARERPHPEEKDEREPEQDRDEQQQPSDDITQHRPDDC